MESNATQQLKIFAPATNQEDEYFIEEDDEQLDGLLDDNPLEDESNSSLQFEYKTEDVKFTLSDVLEQQLKERNMKHAQSCPICGVHPSGTPEPVALKEIFSHMFTEHHFNMGHPDNLVFVPELLETLRDLLQQLHCLYCEKIFKNKQVLKEHMRKKRHVRIHPKNPRPATAEDEDDHNTQNEDDENWEDWIDEKADKLATCCLFCDHLGESPASCLQHTIEAHNFDLIQFCHERQLDFYASVRLVNYLRICTSQLVCGWCRQHFSSKLEFLSHIHAVCNAPLPADWSTDDSLLVPFRANDHLLTSLAESDSDDEAPDASTFVKS